MTPPVRVRRSLLFVPAVRPDRYPKALATGTDAVCLDLEDGVGPGAKNQARSSALALFAKRSPTRAEVSLRINDPTTDLGRRDLDEIMTSGVRPDALMLPKVSSPDDIRTVETILGSDGDELPLIVQIETARGVAAAMEIGAASANVSALFFGAIDLSADIGVRGGVGRLALCSLEGRAGRGRRRCQCARLTIYGCARSRVSAPGERPHPSARFRRKGGDPSDPGFGHPGSVFADS